MKSIGAFLIHRGARSMDQTWSDGAHGRVCEGVGSRDAVFLTSEPRAWARWAGPGKLLGRARACPVVRNTGGMSLGLTAAKLLKLSAFMLPSIIVVAFPIFVKLRCIERSVFGLVVPDFRHLLSRAQGGTTLYP
jgi:hypothetical protein